MKLLEKLLKYRCVLLILVLLPCNAVFTADPPPMVMLKNLSSQMLAELDKNVDNLKTNDRLVYNMVNRILLPHFDLVGMSQSVVGKDNWDKASSSSRQQFVEQFTKYVIRTYSSALQSYDGETMKFYPIRGDITGQSKVQINSDLLHRDGPPIQLQYRIVNQGTKWLIYDFSVDNVSIVQNYRSQFGEVLRQGGLDQLVQQLKQRNQGL